MIYVAAGKIWSRGGTWKGLKNSKILRHGRGNKKIQECWDQARNNRRFLVDLGALQSGVCWGILVVWQDISYVAAIYTAGNVQCFQYHGTWQDDLGVQVLFSAITGPMSFNYYRKLIDLYRKSNQVSYPHNAHWNAVPESLSSDG